MIGLYYQMRNLALREHIESHVDDLKKENEMLQKKNIELSNVVLKFTNGQKMLDNLLNS